MFVVDGENNTIRLSRGDTGEVTIGLSGYSFDSNDRVLFTVRNASTKHVEMRRVLEIENGVVTVPFVNSDTDSLEPGMYEWDVRVIIGPKYNGNSNNDLYDGDEVITPEEPMKLQLIGTVGQI